MLYHKDRHGDHPHVEGCAHAYRGVSLRNFIRTLHVPMCEDGQCIRIHPTHLHKWARNELLASMHGHQDGAQQAHPRCHMGRHTFYVCATLDGHSSHHDLKEPQEHGSLTTDVLGLVQPLSLQQRILGSLARIPFLVCSNLDGQARILSELQSILGGLVRIPFEPHSIRYDRARILSRLQSTLDDPARILSQPQSTLIQELVLSRQFSILVLELALSQLFYDLIHNKPLQLHRAKRYRLQLGTYRR